ncbi:MAG: hypothetical protein ACE5EE_05885 [Fidelibacterota bacterium]
MYEIYLTTHFILMLLWVVPAFYLNFKLLKNYPVATADKKLTILESVQRISDKTELLASSLLPLVGILMIIDQRMFLREGTIHIKILLALLAIGSYHISRGKLRKLIATWKAGESVIGQTRRLAFFRLLTLFLILIIVIIVFQYTGFFRTEYVVRNWFN